jgi:hypothetical protein
MMGTAAVGVNKLTGQAFTSLKRRRRTADAHTHRQSFGRDNLARQRRLRKPRSGRVTLCACGLWVAGYFNNPDFDNWKLSGIRPGDD